MTDPRELNRRALEHFDAGELDEAELLSLEVLDTDDEAAKRIAGKRLDRIAAERRRWPQGRDSPAVTAARREPDVALAVLDGPHRAACIAFLGESLEFSQQVDSSRTIVRDVPAGNHFYVASGGHAALGPYPEFMDTYVDGRSVPDELKRRVRSAGGDVRDATGRGYVPHSIQLEIPFGLIAEMRTPLRGPMRTHIRTALAAAPPQHQHLAHPRLARQILDEWRAIRSS